MPAGVCRVRIEVVGAAGGPAETSGTPGAGGAQAIADFAVAPGETLRGGASAAGWCSRGVGSRSRRSERGWRRRRSVDGLKPAPGGGGATDVRRGGRRPRASNHRRRRGSGRRGQARSAARSALEAATAATGPGMTVLSYSGRRTRRRAGRAVPRHVWRTRPERSRSLGHGDKPGRWTSAATEPPARPAVEVAAEAGSTAEAEAAPAAPSAVATVAAAQASGLQRLSSEPVSALGFGRAKISYADSSC